MTTTSDQTETDSTPTWIWIHVGATSLLGLGAFGAFHILGPDNPIPALLLLVASLPASIAFSLAIVPSDEEAGL